MPRGDRYGRVMTDWHFLVDRDDYRHTIVSPATPTPLDDGEARVRVDAFGFTANNVTYAAAGDLIGYWTFFPAPSVDDEVNWGRVPVWGFGDVVESRCDGLAEGERLFGYFPMSTELVISPDQRHRGRTVRRIGAPGLAADRVQPLHTMCRRSHVRPGPRGRANAVLAPVLHVVRHRRLPGRSQVLRGEHRGAGQRVEQDGVRHGPPAGSSATDSRGRNHVDRQRRFRRTASAATTTS